MLRGVRPNVAILILTCTKHFLIFNFLLRFTGDEIRKAVSLVANNNCKVSLNGKLFDYKDIEPIRAELGIIIC